MPHGHSLEGSPMFPAERVGSSLELGSEGGAVPCGFALRSLGQVLASWRSEITSLPTIRRLSERVLRRRRHPNGSDSVVPLHLEEAQLLAFLDGELSRPGREQVSAHLQGCWSCRCSLRELRANINAFLAQREKQMPDTSAASEQRICELRQRLTQRVQRSPAEMAG